MLKQLTATLTACTTLCQMLERCPTGRRYLLALAIMGATVTVFTLLAESIMIGAWRW
ncbi:hypothetical protein [Frateuria sp. YIM B11624]|uniref:hypothetical protein n=1 Tax=Frateuria sp. YIM B11624 TaxID=3143185 RepID=UPI003C742A12